MDFLETASVFLTAVWDFIVKFFSILVENFSKIGEFFEYTINFILEIPPILLTMFDSSPDFVKLGFGIINVGIITIFIFKLIKMIRDITI